MGADKVIVDQFVPRCHESLVDYEKGAEALSQQLTQRKTTRQAVAEVNQKKRNPQKIKFRLLEAIETFERSTVARKSNSPRNFKLLRRS